MVDDYKTIYEKLIENKINLKENSLGDIPGETKANADDYGKKIDKLQQENSLIITLLSVCIVALVISIIAIVVDICRDNTLLTSFQNKEIEINDKINIYEDNLLELKVKQEGLDKYIDEKIQNEVNEAILEFYKTQGISKK